MENTRRTKRPAIARGMNRRQFLALTAMTPLLPVLGRADVEREPDVVIVGAGHESMWATVSGADRAGVEVANAVVNALA